MSCEVAALEHELKHTGPGAQPSVRSHDAQNGGGRRGEGTYAGDNAVERAALVPEAVLAGRELAEVARGPRHLVVVELEDDAARGLAVDGDVELRICEFMTRAWRPG